MGHTTLEKANSLKATVKNLRGSVEKLSPKESVEGADTVLRGSVRAPEGFSEGKPEAAKPRELRPLLRGQFFHTAPRIFNSRFQTVGFLQCCVAH